MRPETDRRSKPASEDEIVERLHDVLLAPSANGTISRLDDVMGKVTYLTPTRAPLEGDPVLTHLLGFGPGDIPDFHHNFCGAMGRLIEVIVSEIFWLRRPSLSRQCWREDAEKLIEMGRFPRKWTTDLRNGVCAIEIKYRYGSGQTCTDQVAVAEELRKLGYKPIMFILRTDSPLEDACRRGGWQIESGMGLVRYIERHTGINLIDILKRLGAHPSVRRRLAEWRKKIQAKRDAVRIASYLNATFEQRGRLHEIIASDEAAVRDILSRRQGKSTGGSSKGCLRQPELRQRIEDHANREIAFVQAFPAEAALRSFGQLDPKAQAEHLSLLIDMMSDRARLELTALRG